LGLNIQAIASVVTKAVIGLAKKEKKLLTLAILSVIALNKLYLFKSETHYDLPHLISNTV
jgi:hypothetical protein